VRRGKMVPMCIGDSVIQLRQSWADGYISMKGSLSNKGWHQRWFYLRSNADAPLPPYTGRFFEEARKHLDYGPVTADKWKIDTLLQVVKRLVNRM
jgi:hypothetical protein